MNALKRRSMNASVVFALIGIAASGNQHVPGETLGPGEVMTRSISPASSQHRYSARIHHHGPERRHVP